MAQDNSPSLVAEGASFIALSTVAIVLRFWSRALLPSKKFQADDWTALAAYPFVVSALAVLITWAKNGLGEHSVAVSQYALRLIITKKLVWNTGITLSRVSVLLFYRRLFDNTRWFRVLFWMGIAFNVAWWTMLFFFVMFGCHPVQKQWDSALPGVCMQELPGQILSSLTSFVLDVYILVIPFPFLYRLQMKWGRKICVALIFAMGYAVPVLSLGRLIVTVKNSNAINYDPDWGYGLQEYWSMCEISISFIGVTIPGIWTLARRAIQFGPFALFNDHEYTSQHRLSSDPSTSSRRGTSVSEPRQPVMAVQPGRWNPVASPSRINKDPYQQWTVPANMVDKILSPSPTSTEKPIHASGNPSEAWSPATSPDRAPKDPEQSWYSPV